MVDTLARDGTVVTSTDTFDADAAFDPEETSTIGAADGDVVADPGHGRFVARERPDWEF